jgi:hypothetical protein
VLSTYYTYHRVYERLQWGVPRVPRVTVQQVCAALTTQIPAVGKPGIYMQA